MGAGASEYCSALGLLYLLLLLSLLCFPFHPASKLLCSFLLSWVVPSPSAAADHARAFLEGELGAAPEGEEAGLLPADHALLAMEVEERAAFLEVGPGTGVREL